MPSQGRRSWQGKKWWTKWTIASWRWWLRVAVRCWDEKGLDVFCSRRWLLMRVDVYSFKILNSREKRALFAVFERSHHYVISYHRRKIINGIIQFHLLHLRFMNHDELIQKKYSIFSYPSNLHTAADTSSRGSRSGCTPRENVSYPTTVENLHKMYMDCSTIPTN